MTVAGERPRPQEAELLMEARRGNRAAFGDLYRLFLTDVREFCTRRISDSVRAEDLAQDTFIRAFERISSFKEGAAFWPWVSTIARNLCIDELRQRRRAVEETSAEPPEPREPLTYSIDLTSEEAVERQCRQQVRLVLGDAFARLSRREGRMVWEHAVEERSWDQIAAADATTVHAVRNTAWRARAVLRNAVGDRLRDLRSWVTFPVVAIAQGWRRLRNRIGNRVDPHLSLAGGAIIERAVMVALGIATLAPIGAGAMVTSATSQRSLALEAAPTSRTPNDLAAVPGLRPPAGSRSSVGVEGGPLKAAAGAGFRDDGAAPSNAQYQLEIRDPNDNVLYWEETEIECGDGRVSHLLPEGAIIRTYC